MKPTNKYPAVAATHMVGARTMVMDRPPEMVMHLRPENRASLRATRVAPSQTPSIMMTTEFRRAQEPASLAPSAPPDEVRVAHPPPPPPPASLRTRMVDLREALTAPPLPPLPYARSVCPPPLAAELAPPLAPPSDLPAPPPLPPPPVSQPRLLLGARGIKWSQTVGSRPSLLLIAAAALLLLVFLVPVWSGGGGEAQAEAQTQVEAPTPKAPATLPARVEEPLQEQPLPALDAPTEAQVGALLLSGHRLEALAMYRRLAEMHPADAGIEAMILVLEQKVATP